MVDQEQTLMRILAQIEASPAGDAGALRVATGCDLPGLVLVEDRRICWAAAPGTRRRRTEIVCEKSGANPGEIEAIFRACKDAGRPIGEVLVERNVVTARELSEILLHQTVEALAALSRMPGGASATWTAHRGGTYRPQFTFSVLDVWARSVAETRQIDVAPLGTRVARAAARGFGAVFVDQPGQDPAPAFAVGQATMAQVGAVGRWAQKALRRSRRATALGPRDNVFSGPKGCLVAWREQGLLCVAADHQEGSWSRIMNESAAPAVAHAA